MPSTRKWELFSKPEPLLLFSSPPLLLNLQEDFNSIASTITIQVKTPNFKQGQNFLPRIEQEVRKRSQGKASVVEGLDAGDKAQGVRRGSGGGRTGG
eukprot:1841289-Rhodomonas_salina.1